MVHFDFIAQSDAHSCVPNGCTPFNLGESDTNEPKLVGTVPPHYPFNTNESNKLTDRHK